MQSLCASRFLSFCARLARTFLFFCAKSRVKHFCLTSVDFFVIESGSSQLAFALSEEEPRGHFLRPCRARHDPTLSYTLLQSCKTTLESRDLRAKVAEQEEAAAL